MAGKNIGRTLNDHPRRIVFCPVSNVISHTGRCIELARELKSRGCEIFISGTSKYLRDPKVVQEDEFGYYELIDFDTDEALEALRSPGRTFNSDLLQRHMDCELNMLKILKPHLVVVDFRLTMFISARVIQTPIVSLINARWVPQYFAGKYKAPDTHPIPLFFKKIWGENLTDIFWPTIINLIQRYKLAPYHYLFRKYGMEVKTYLPDILIGNYNLILDSALLGPTIGLPENFRQVGPIIWSPKIPMPDGLDKLDPNKPTIYITMGSTGHKDLFRVLFNAFGDTKYQVIVTTGGQLEINKDNFPENFWVEKYLPGERAMERADVVICHGGNQTVYQTIKTATPCLVIATHLDQEWAGYDVQEQGAGIFLTMVKVMSRPGLIMESTQRLFDNLDTYRKNMGILRKDLERYNGLKKAADYIEECLNYETG